MAWQLLSWDRSYSYSVDILNFMSLSFPFPFDSRKSRDVQQELANYSPWPTFGPPLGFVNKALLGHSHTLSFTHSLWLPAAAVAGPYSYNKEHLALTERSVDLHSLPFLGILNAQYVFIECENISSQETCFSFFPSIFSPQRYLTIEASPYPPFYEVLKGYFP